MGKGGSSELELELGRRGSQVGLGDAAVTTNHKISVLNSTKNSFSLMQYVDHGSLGVVYLYILLT